MYDLLPGQIAGLGKDDLVLFNVSDDDKKNARQLTDRISSYFSGIDEFYRELGIHKMDLRQVRKSKQIGSDNE
jgi:hypothetical protein